MGSDKLLKFRSSGDGTAVWIPAEASARPYCDWAWVLAISPK
jgi:hypothetical protein